MQQKKPSKIENKTHLISLPNNQLWTLVQQLVSESQAWRWRHQMTNFSPGFESGWLTQRELDHLLGKFCRKCWKGLRQSWISTFWGPRYPPPIWSQLNPAHLHRTLRPFLTAHSWEGSWRAFGCLSRHVKKKPRGAGGSEVEICQNFTESAWVLPVVAIPGQIWVPSSGEGLRQVRLPSKSVSSKVVLFEGKVLKKRERRRRPGPCWARELGALNVEREMPPSFTSPGSATHPPCTQTALIHPRP